MKCSLTDGSATWMAEKAEFREAMKPLAGNFSTVLAHLWGRREECNCTGKRKKIGGKGLWAKFLVRLSSNINARPERHELVEKKFAYLHGIKKEIDHFSC